jgi:PAS domain S-box-containing protein
MTIDSLKILTIDDNEDNLFILSELISDEIPGASVETASTGPAGIALALRHDPDVVLLDIMMPEMDGFEVCRAMKRDERLAHIPVVFVTAMGTDRPTRLKALQAGAEGFIAKPIDTAELIAQIRAMAKIKAAAEFKRGETERLAAMVARRTLAFERELDKRIKAEQALLESERRLKEAQQLASIGNWEWDLAAQSLSWSEEVYRIFGIAPHSIAPSVEAFEAAIHPEDREEFLRRRAEMLEEKKFACIDHRIIRPDGAVHYVQEQARVVLNERGEVARVIGTVQDISPRKRAEKILQIRLALFEFAPGHTLEELLKKTLDEIGELTGSPIGFYHFVEPDQKTLSLQTWSTRTEKEFCAASGKGSHYSIDKAGVWVDCVHQRRAVVHNDYHALPHRKGLPPGHAPVTRELAVPIIRSGLVVAILGIGNKPTNYTDDDLAIVTNLADISYAVVEQKRFIEALNISEEKYRTVADFTYDWEYWSAPDGRFVYVSPSCERITGYRAEEFLQDPTLMRKIVPPEDAGKIAAHIHSDTITEENPEQHRIDFPIITKSGERKWIAHACRRVYGKDGAYLGRRASNRDITKRKKAEQALKENERLLRRAQEIAHVGHWSWDITTNIVTWSDEMHRIFGIDKERFSGDLNAVIEAAIHPDDRAAVHASNAAVTKENRPQPMEYRIVRPEGTVRHVWAEAGDTVCDGQGNIVRLSGVVQDITDRKKAEDSMLRAQKLESISVLAGGIAHDFNNMLAGIFGYLDMAAESLAENKTKQTGRYLIKARAVFERARALTMQLLTFSKGGAPVRKIMRIATLVQESAQFALSGSNVSCRFALAEDLWPCNCDENQIGQVIDNIVINAKQAMSMGGSISVSGTNMTFGPHEARAPRLAGNYVRLSIQDEGVGIPAEILDRIFDPFFTTKETGHGLGLATVYSIVRRHGGWIEVQSEKGKGSTFHVFLPAADQPGQGEAEGDAVRHKGSGAILVMDDEEYMREVVEAVLQAMGYTVAQARDGREALMLFSRALQAGAPFAVSLLDLTVPAGRSGKDIVAEMRSMQSDALIVAASGYSEDPIMAQPKDFGFDASIRKPFSRVELARLLERLRG